MAIVHSSDGSGRRAARRAQSIDEALDHAVAVMTEDGVAALTVSEVARRMGIRAPSLYKYFPSLHSMYDELFGRGVRSHLTAVLAAVEHVPPGTDRIVASAVASVRWAVENPALAQLMFSRPVPKFEPSEAAFAPSIEGMNILRGEFVAAVELGQLATDTDLDELITLFTVILSGVVGQQLSNEPGRTYEDGRFSSLTERAVENLLAAYRFRRKS